MHANICERLRSVLYSKHIGFFKRTLKQNLPSLSFHHHGPNNDASFRKQKDANVDETSAKKKLDIEVIKDHTLRQTLKTLYAEKRKRHVQSIEKSETNGKYDQLQVQIYHDGRNLQPLVVVLVGQKSYCINPFPAFPRFMANNSFQMPVVENILFTRLNWKSTFALLPHLLNPRQSDDSAILSFFGPPGTTNNFTLAIPLLLSVKARDGHKNRLVYHEYYNNGINPVHDDDVEISMINILRNPSSFKKNVQISDSIKNPITGYIFKHKSISENSTSNKIYSWKDFDTVESYIKYIQNLKSNQFEKLENEVERISAIAFVDFPDSDYFDDMLIENPFYNYHKTESEISCIFHLTPSKVSSLPKYKLWMKSFGPRCKHISASNQQSFEMCNFKSEAYRGAFHTIYPHFFPLHGNKHSLRILQNVMLSAVSHSLPVPWKIFNQCQGNTTVEESLSVCDGYKKNVSFVIQRHLNSLKEIKQLPRELSKELTEVLYPRLVVLGSGGSNISIQRASPSYLVQLSKDISILLDCGVDTVDQLCQHYGEQLLPQILSTIKIVVISHKHSDHWMGLVNLLQEMETKIMVPYNTLVFLPKKVQKFLEDHCLLHNDPLLARVHFFPNEDAFQENSFLNQVARKVNLKQFRLIPVDHGLPTYGVVMKCWNGQKLVYSSDTLPMCENLIKEGLDADLLIHDCLYTDDSTELLASFKMHSTMRGAVATAHHMKAKNLMLTHFTGECDILPVVNLQADEPFGGQILYALDHLEISIDHLRYFPHLHEMLQKVMRKKTRKRLVSNRVKITNDLVELYDDVSSVLSST